jgi:hypothetical protein
MTHYRLFLIDKCWCRDKFTHEKKDVSPVCFRNFIKRKLQKASLQLLGNLILGLSDSYSLGESCLFVSTSDCKTYNPQFEAETNMPQSYVKANLAHMFSQGQISISSPNYHHMSVANGKLFTQVVG